MTPTQKELHRFWSRVDRAGPNDCWEWQGSLINTGYGEFYWGKRGRCLAHRYSFLLVNGYLPDDLFVCHSCDNPRCVNPAHLWLGTPADNARDMHAKGRWRKINNPPHIPISRKGESHHSAKLTEADVLAIRASTLSRAELARCYGVSWGSLDRALSGKTWRHVAARDSKAA